MSHTALLLAGHGASGSQDPFFLQLREEIRSRLPDTYLVMLHGEPSLQTLIPSLKKRQISRVLLFPLLLSPASHFTRDIASEKAPLRLALKEAGIETVLIGEGLLREPRVLYLLTEICLQKASEAGEGGVLGS